MFGDLVRAVVALVLVPVALLVDGLVYLVASVTKEAHESFHYTKTMVKSVGDNIISAIK